MTGQLGWHWVFDAKADAARLNEANIRRVLQSLPKELGLRTVSDAQCFSHDDNGERSAAGIILIAESHFSLHAFPERGVLHGDLFSCKPFDLDRAKQILAGELSITEWNETLLDRGDAEKRKLRAS